MAKRKFSRTCSRTGKIKYRDSIAAKMALARVGRDLRSYKCPFCHGYHLTSQAYRPHKR